MFLYLVILVAGLASGQDNCCNNTDTIEMMVRLENRIDDMERILDASETEQLQNMATAFFAAKVSDEIYGAYKTIVFENAVTNTGNAYDPTSGIFRAPTAGLYAFFATVLAMDDYKVESFFEKNDNYTISSGTVTVILQLNESDTISVKNVHEEGHVRGHRYSSFSGHIVR